MPCRRMAPKAVAKFTRAVLEEHTRAEVIAIAKKERDAGARPKIGSLSRATSEIIDDLMRIKIAAPAVDERERVAARRAELEDELAALKIAEAAEKPAPETRPPPRPKLEEPSKLPDDPDEDTYEVWRMELEHWTETYGQDYEIRYMANAVLKVLGVKTKKLVFKTIPKGQMNIESIMAVLTGEYGGTETLRTRDAVGAYRRCRRGAKTLHAHLVEWKRLRTEAMSTGDLLPQRADAHDLLDSAELTIAQSQIVLGQYEERMEAAEAAGKEFDGLKCMMDRLKTLEQAFAHGGGGAKKKDRGETAMIGESVAPKCQTCGKTHKGKCWHAPGGNPGKGKGQGKGAQQNKWRTDKKNSQGRKQTKGSGKGSGDWKCACGWLVFGRSQATFCGKCGSKKPDGASGGADKKERT